MKKKQQHIKDLGFQVPQDFFKNFEEEMMTQHHLDDKGIKETGFNVPDGYFETLENHLLPVKQVRVVQLPQGLKVRTILYPLLAIAAVIAVVFSININTQPTDIASLDTADLEYYLINEANLYDDGTVELLFSDNDILDNMNLTDGIQTDELYNYLEEEIEFNEIITE